MKNIIKHISILSIVITCFTSCELTQDIDDIDLLFQLDEELVITSEVSANLALTGAYSSFKVSPENLLLAPSLLSGTAIPGTRPRIDVLELQSWQNNLPLAGNTTEGGMVGLYKVINDANWVIEKVNNLDDGLFINEGRRMEIIGEAYGLRALAHFFLLRNWGQWYDEASEYGIALRLSPIRSAEALPRNTVAETYAQIHSDLDFAITNAPDIGGNRVYINKIAARSIKAKTYLYQGNYVMAASTAKALIDEAGAAFALSPTFLEIFDNSSDALFNNSELLFGFRGDQQAPLQSEGWTSSINFSPTFISNLSTGTMTVDSQIIDYDLDRVNNTTIEDRGSLINSKRANPFAGETSDLIYFSRLSEVYLIYAEAEARSNENVTTEALNALNAIRIRSGATTTGGDGFETYPTTISLDQFLEAVRIEKTVELIGELGEEWFDLVRYDWIDGFGSGFQVLDVKPSATNKDKFILPIPLESILAGNNVEKQNPSYE